MPNNRMIYFPRLSPELVGQHQSCSNLDSIRFSAARLTDPLPAKNVISILQTPRRNLSSAQHYPIGVCSPLFTKAAVSIEFPIRLLARRNNIQ